MKKALLFLMVFPGVIAVMFNFSLMNVFAEEAHHKEGEEGSKQTLKKKVEGHEFTLEIRPAHPAIGSETEFEVKIVESIEEKVGSFDDEWPLINAKVYFRFVKERTFPGLAEEIKAHSESEAGVYGSQYTFQKEGDYEAMIGVITGDGKVIETSFPFSVREHEEE